MKNNSSSYVILGHSEIADAFVPTAHGTFPTRSAAEAFARANIKVIKFKVEPAE
jgi:hypothetical protein